MRHLYKDYYLDTDQYNYILCERKIKTAGKDIGSEYYIPLGYYGTNMKLLYNRLLELKVHENINNSSYEQLLEMIKEIIELKEKNDINKD